ncbi:MAG: SDR family oxidoreductase [Candidatus Latescibacterota bacterium]|nr:SDR family oxidoreductase [Candidatus Latescibacterota bacterium]
MLRETDPSLEGMRNREIFDKFVSGNIPLGREQSPEDIGNLVAFLCSEEARNITGQTIHVDGGVAME